MFLQGSQKTPLRTQHTLGLPGTASGVGHLRDSRTGLTGQRPKPEAVWGNLGAVCIAVAAMTSGAKAADARA